MVRGPSVLMVVKKGRIRDGEKPRGMNKRMGDERQRDFTLIEQGTKRMAV